MGQQYHADFRQGLVNIKSRDIQAVAARMCRILRDFPRSTAARKVTKVINGENVTVDRTGTIFDTLWNENVGSCLAVLDGISMSTGKTIVECLYAASDFVMTHRNVLLGVVPKTSKYTTDLEAFNSKIASSGLMDIALPLESPSHLTYSQLGYTLDQATLDEGARSFDVYEFGKWLSTTDIVTVFWTIDSILQSYEWTNRSSTVSDKTVISDGDAFKIKAVRMEELTVQFLNIILDIGHKIDELSACKKVEVEEIEDPPDPSSFDPVAEQYLLPAEIQPTSWTTGFEIKTAGSYRFAFVVDDPYHLAAMMKNDESVVFAVTSVTTDDETGVDKAIYLTESYDCKIGDIIRYKIVPHADGNLFKSFRVKMYLLCDEDPELQLEFNKLDSPEKLPEDLTHWSSYVYPNNRGLMKLKITVKNNYEVKSVNYGGVFYTEFDLEFDDYGYPVYTTTETLEVSDMSEAALVTFVNSNWGGVDKSKTEDFVGRNVISVVWRDVNSGDWSDNVIYLDSTDVDWKLVITTRYPYTVSRATYNDVALSCTTEFQDDLTIFTYNIQPVESVGTVIVNYGPGTDTFNPEMIISKVLIPTYVPQAVVDEKLALGWTELTRDDVSGSTNRDGRNGDKLTVDTMFAAHNRVDFIDYTDTKPISIQLAILSARIGNASTDACPVLSDSYLRWEDYDHNNSRVNSYTDSDYKSGGALAYPELKTKDNPLETVIASPEPEPSEDEDSEGDEETEDQTIVEYSEDHTHYRWIVYDFLSVEDLKEFVIRFTNSNTNEPMSESDFATSIANGTRLFYRVERGSVQGNDKLKLLPGYIPVRSLFLGSSKPGGSVVSGDAYTMNAELACPFLHFGKFGKHSIISEGSSSDTVIPTYENSQSADVTYDSGGGSNGSFLMTLKLAKLPKTGIAELTMSGKYPYQATVVELVNEDGASFVTPPTISNSTSGWEATAKVTGVTNINLLRVRVKLSLHSNYIISGYFTFDPKVAFTSGKMKYSDPVEYSSNQMTIPWTRSMNVIYPIYKKGRLVIMIKDAVSAKIKSIIAFKDSTKISFTSQTSPYAGYTMYTSDVVEIGDEVNPVVITFIAPTATVNDFSTAVKEYFWERENSSTLLSPNSRDIGFLMMATKTSDDYEGTSPTKLSTGAKDYGRIYATLSRYKPTSSDSLSISNTENKDITSCFTRGKLTTLAGNKTFINVADGYYQFPQTVVMALSVGETLTLSYTVRGESVVRSLKEVRDMNVIDWSTKMNYSTGEQVRDKPSTFCLPWFMYAKGYLINRAIFNWMNGNSDTLTAEIIKATPERVKRYRFVRLPKPAVYLFVTTSSKTKDVTTTMANESSFISTLAWTGDRSTLDTVESTEAELKTGNTARVNLFNTYGVKVKVSSQNVFYSDKNSQHTNPMDTIVTVIDLRTNPDGTDNAVTDIMLPAAVEKTITMMVRLEDYPMGRFRKI